MIGSRSAPADIRQTTFIELMMIVVFLVMVLLAGLALRNAALVADGETLRRAQEDLQRELSQILSAGDTPEELSQEIRSRLAEIGTLRGDRDRLGMQVEHLQSRLAFLDAALQDTRAGLGRVLGLDANSSVDTLLRALDDQASRLAQADARVQSLRETLRTAGLAEGADPESLIRSRFGVLPCWMDAKGNPENTYAVTLHESGIEVRPSWPDRLADEIQAHPELRPSSGIQSIQSFRRFGDRVLRWSKARNDCRIFVTVTDRTRTKDPFQQGQDAVRSYFYFGRIRR